MSSAVRAQLAENAAPQLQMFDARLLRVGTAPAAVPAPAVTPAEGDLWSLCEVTVWAPTEQQFQHEQLRQFALGLVAATTPSSSTDLVSTRPIYQPRHGRPPRRGLLRRLGMGRLVAGLVTVGMLATILGLLAFFAATLLGFRTAAVLSGSMRPTLPVGALVVSRAAAPLSLHPGDLVTFRSPSVQNQTVTHRVVSRQQSGDTVNFVTRGDANQVSEKWQVAVSAKVGRGLFHVNFVGRWLVELSGAWARTIIILGAAAVLAGFVLSRIVRGSTE